MYRKYLVYSFLWLALNADCSIAVKPQIYSYMLCEFKSITGYDTECYFKDWSKTIITTFDSCTPDDIVPTQKVTKYFQKKQRNFFFALMQQRCQLGHLLLLHCGMQSFPLQQGEMKVTAPWHMGVCLQQPFLMRQYVLITFIPYGLCLISPR
jgi:hypothetical protein